MCNSDAALWFGGKIYRYTINLIGIAMSNLIKNSIYYSSCKKCLTGNTNSSKIITVIALQKPVRPATGGEPAGSPLFALRRHCICQGDFMADKLYSLIGG